MACVDFQASRANTLASWLRRTRCGRRKSKMLVRKPEPASLSMMIGRKFRLKKASSSFCHARHVLAAHESRRCRTDCSRGRILGALQKVAATAPATWLRRSRQIWQHARLLPSEHGAILPGDAIHMAPARIHGSRVCSPVNGITATSSPSKENPSRSACQRNSKVCLQMSPSRPRFGAGILTRSPSHRRNCISPSSADGFRIIKQVLCSGLLRWLLRSARTKKRESEGIVYSRRTDWQVCLSDLQYISDVEDAVITGPTMQGRYSPIPCSLILSSREDTEWRS